MRLLHAFNPPTIEQLYSFNFDKSIKITDARQAVCDAFQSNDNDAMSVNDIKNIAHVSQSVIKTMIKNGILTPSDKRLKNAESFNYKYCDTGTVTLNDEQKFAADTIADALKQNSFSVHLLDGRK